MSWLSRSSSYLPKIAHLIGLTELPDSLIYLIILLSLFRWCGGAFASFRVTFPFCVPCVVAFKSTPKRGFHLMVEYYLLMVSRRAARKRGRRRTRRRQNTCPLTSTISARLPTCPLRSPSPRDPRSSYSQ